MAMHVTTKPLKITAANGSTGPSLTGADRVRQASVGDREQPPLARHASKLALAAVLEADPGADDEVLDCPRDDDLARLGQPENSGADVHGDPADVLTDHLDLSGVERGSQIEAEVGL